MLFLRFLFFTSFCLLLLTTGYSQKILVFDKGGKIKRIRYYEGDYIRFLTKSDFFINGNISQIKDSSFTINGKVIGLKDVVKIYNTQKYKGYQLATNILVYPAFGYFPIITTNRLINNDSPIINENTLIYSSIFFGSFIIFNKLANRPYKITEKRPLRIIDLTP